MAFRSQVQAVLSDEMRIVHNQLLAETQKKHDGGHSKHGSSLSALFATLLPTFLLALLMLSAFLILRKREPRIYSPRTYAGILRDDEETPEASATLLSWTKDFWALPDTHALNHQSLDAYLYLRFFKVLISISVLGTFITWPILFPVNATGGGGLSQLDILTIGNIDSGKSVRCYAHALVACLFLGLVMLIITRETMLFVNIRLAYLASNRNASRISSKTVLFTSLPDILLSEAALKRSLTGVKRVWIATDCKHLIKLVEDFENIAIMLENAEISLARDAHKAYLELKRKSDGNAGENEPREEARAAIDETRRPVHRLKPLVGDKVDTIDWCRQYLELLQPKIEEARLANEDGQNLSIPVAFVEFDTQSAAQVAFQRGFPDEPLLAPRYIGVTPSEVVWDNLSIRPAQRKARMYLAMAAIAWVILFWTVPVAIIGTISNIGYLTEKVPFLRFLNDLPPSVLGVVTGLLPTVLLSSLMSLVPYICRFFARLGGELTLSGIEHLTQTWYFAFQVVQVFLVTTFSSGAASVAAQIWEDPTMAARLLATNLPKASNFYVSYFVLTGLVTSSTTVLNIADLLLIKIVGKVLDTTPRQKYTRHVSLTGFQWGQNYPKYTNLGVIAIAYSTIAPLVLGFATVGLSFLYLAFRYQLLYTNATLVSTRGAAYGRALQHLTVGVYISELCLIGLFSIRGAYGPLVIMLVFFASTILYHLASDLALGRLTRYLPTFLDGAQSVSDRRGSPEQESVATRIVSHVGEQFAIEPHTVNEHFIRYDRALSRDPDPKPTEPHSHNQLSFIPTLLTNVYNARFFRVPSFAHFTKQVLDSSFSEPVEAYPMETEKKAYLHPALAAETTKLWIVRDEPGVSKMEIKQNKGVVETSDKGAWFDHKGRVVWEKEKVKEMPPWKERVRF